MKKNTISLAFILAVLAVSNSHAGNNPAQLVLDTKLAIANAQVSTVTPLNGSSQVILEGNLDNDGTFSQTPGTRAEFKFTSRKFITDKEWFQDVTLVFEKANQVNGYNIAQVDSEKSSVVICRNPVQPICLSFKPFGQSLQPIQSAGEITYYILDPVVGKSRPSIMLQFILQPK